MNEHSKSQGGFTLIELLTAVTIMSFMLLMMTQITGLTQQTWRAEQNRIDNFTKARSMLDLIVNDLQHAIFRGDLPVFGTGAPTDTPVATGGGSHYFTSTSFTNAFYTRLPGINPSSGATRDVSLVSYALNSANQGDSKIVLQRSDLFVPWSSAQNVSFQGDMGPLLQNVTPHEVAPGVVGFRMVFRRADGTLIDQSQYTGYSTSNPVVAVDVGLAVIGKQCLTLLSDSQVSQIRSALATVSISNGIKATWDQQILTPSFYSSYPKDLGEGLKTFERWVACPAF